MSLFLIKIALFAFLGVALAAAGVGVVDKPWQFIVIMGLVVGIDIVSGIMGGR